MEIKDKKRYKEAKKKVEEIKGFYIHFAIYLIINFFLFVLNMITSENWWFYWVTLGWGLAVAIHGISLLIERGMFGRKWEERKIKEYMEKDTDEEKSEE